MAPKVILVTGGNRSIGFGIVQSIAQRSSEHTVIIASRKKENAETAIAQLKDMGLCTACYPLALDVTDDDSIRAAVAEVDQKFGKLDGQSDLSHRPSTQPLTNDMVVLINNAGIAILEEHLKDFRRIWSEQFNVNVISVRIISELFMPLLRKAEDPRILNISSLRASFDRVINGHNPPVVSVAYSTSKTALNMMMLQMAKQYQDVTFYAVSPDIARRP